MYKKRKIENRKHKNQGENILKQPMKIKIVKLWKKTYQKNQKKKKRRNKKDRFLFK